MRPTKTASKMVTEVPEASLSPFCQLWHLVVWRFLDLERGD